MGADGSAVFDTLIGTCGIAWGADGIVGIQLPESGDGMGGGDEGGTRACMAKRFPSASGGAAPPAAVAAAMGAIRRLMRGDDADLSAVPLDFGIVTPFRREVYRAARLIPPGSTSTYGELAQRIGNPGAARAVGQAMGNNPFPIVVPCHRVVGAGGLGGFSADGGVSTKARMLAIEGVRLEGAGPSPRSRAGSTARRPALPFDAASAVDHLRQADTILSGLIEEVGPLALQLRGASSVFGALAEAIVYQQLSGKAAATIFARVQALFADGGAALVPETVLGAADDELRGAGLSRAKTASLRDLALKAVEGDLPTLAETEGMDDAEVVARLVTVRGIGPWTAEMFLIFTLGRPDVLPLDDQGVRTGFANAFGLPELPTRQELADHGQRWSPYRTAASWYLWQAAATGSPHTHSRPRPQPQQELKPCRQEKKYRRSRSN